MKEIKRFLIDVLIIFGLVFSMAFSSSCTMYNHDRIKSNMLEQRIRVTSNQEYIKLLNAGMSPEDVVKFGTIQDEDGRPIGVKAAIELSNIKGIKSYFTTFKEEPVSSTLSLLIDAAIAYYASEGIKNIKDNYDDKGEQVQVYNSITITESDNVTINQDYNINPITISSPPTDPSAPTVPEK